MNILDRDGSKKVKQHNRDISSVSLNDCFPKQTLFRGAENLPKAFLRGFLI